jgi:hypothetical protein
LMEIGRCRAIGIPGVRLGFWDGFLVFRTVHVGAFRPFDIARIADSRRVFELSRGASGAPRLGRPLLPSRF